MKLIVNRMEIVVTVLTLLTSTGFSQSFLNLNFESPIPPLPSGPAIWVPITNALPAWSGYIDGNQVEQIVYNTIALDSSAISLHSSTSPIFQPLQGSYSVYLQGGRFSSISAAIAQTGLVPQTAQSLVFLSGFQSFLQVTFSGQILPFTELGRTTDYVAFGADVSSFAGQSGELRFTAFNGGGGLIDSIRFSTQAIPEPSTFSLFGCGVLLFGAARVAFKRKQ